LVSVDPNAVDQQVNEWLAGNSNAKVCKTNTAFQRFRDHGKYAITGKTTTRRAVGIAISVWYEEPTSRAFRSNPATWIFEYAADRTPKTRRNTLYFGHAKKA
jgi:hypothetical protein